MNSPVKKGAGEARAAAPSRRAVILLSGGLDSATTGAIARAEGFELYALTVDYGQRHRFELAAARRVAAWLEVCRHETLQVDLARFGGSALTAAIDVPKGGRDEPVAAGIPVTYVPARNTILLALALGYAEVCQTGDLFLGVNAIDYSGYPDCRPEFVHRFEQLANVATKAAVEGTLRFAVRTPLLHLTKAEIIRRGLALDLDYGLTFSCYDPNQRGISCGACDACRLRRRGFAEAGVADPIEYQR